MQRELVFDVIVELRTRGYQSSMGFGVQLHNSSIGTSANHKFIEKDLRQYVH